MFDFIAFVRKKWSEYSASSGQKGTVVDELAVKPSGLVLSDFYNTLVDQRTVNDITNWENMTLEQLGFFGNKFFIPIISGDFAFGVVRIYFDQKKNFVFSEDSRVVSNDGLEFQAVQPGTVSKNSFKESSEQFALYYVDLPVIATSPGNSYNVNAGEISQIINIDFTYKAVTNLQNFTYGSYAESKEQYYERLRYGINDRSLMNARSLNVRLPEFFPVINAMYISGAGNRYMKRDLVAGTDLSVPASKADYLGKTQGDNIVPHVAFYGFFPPQPGGQFSEIYGPHTIFSDYDYPLTIDPVDGTQFVETDDPAVFGFPTNQEATNEMYRGLFFDDYKTFMEIASVDLFNIDDEQVGFTPIVAPNTGWMYGANGRGSGNFGVLDDGVSDIDVLNFQNNVITLAGGAKESISINKDILKRTGVKLTGSFLWPEVNDVESTTAHSNLQIMVGGANGELVDGYTGVGFGVRVVDAYNSEDIDQPNAVIYFAHNEKYGTSQVFAADEDFSTHISITDLGALAEKEWRVEPGVEYEFEFILHEDLHVTLYLYKSTNRQILDTDDKENQLRFELPKKVLNIFNRTNGGLLSVDSDRYGTMMKVTLDTENLNPDNEWNVIDLKAFDMANYRSMSMHSIDVSSIEDPVNIYLRAYGNSGVLSAASDGYKAFIWDKEGESPLSGDTELTRGAWKELPGISNADGSKDSTNALFRQQIQNLERYRITSSFGETIFLLITTTGTTLAKSRFEGSIEDDVASTLRVDYMKVESQDVAAYHSRNKADIYMATIKNSEELETVSTILTKSPTDNFFTMSLENDCKMPVAEIVSVTIGTATVETEVLSDTEYSIIYENPLFTGSSKEKIRVVLNDSDADTITVEYRTYPSIADIQDFFDSSQYEKIYGDILARHMLPTDLSFTVYYTGNVNDDQLIDEIKKYVDDNITGTFSTRELINYLYDNELVNNVQEPIEISYTKWNDEGELESGKFTDTLTIRPIDFFRVSDLTVSKL